MIKVLIITTAFFFPQANHCPRTELNEPCYGECGAFLDNNSNSICDEWERFHEKNKETKSIEKTKKNRIIQISLITIFLILISEIFFKRSNITRLIWNWLLLISMLISSLSGFFLYFLVLTEMRKNLYEIHIQASTFFFISSLYHTMKRFKCMIK